MMHRHDDAQRSGEQRTTISGAEGSSCLLDIDCPAARAGADDRRRPESQLERFVGLKDLVVDDLHSDNLPDTKGTK